MSREIHRANSTVPAAIKSWVERRGLKYGAVAKKMGISPQAFCDMLNGRRMMRIIDLEQAAKAIGCTPGELFATEGD